MPPILLEPKLRGSCLQLPVISDTVYEAHRTSILAVSATLQGLLLLYFRLFLRIPSCGDVAGPPLGSPQLITLWSLQVASILTALFSNNRYSSSLWLLLSLPLAIAALLLLLDLDTQYCSSGSLLWAGLDGAVPSTLSTALPASVPQLAFPVPTLVVLYASVLHSLLAAITAFSLLVLVIRDIVLVLQAVPLLPHGRANAWSYSRRLPHQPRWGLLVPTELLWLSPQAQSALLSHSRPTFLDNAFERQHSAFGSSSSSSSSSGATSRPRMPGEAVPLAPLWRLGNSDAVEAAAELQGRLAAAWAADTATQQRRGISSSSAAAIPRRTCCAWLAQAAASLPVKLLTSLLATWMVLAPAALWTLGPARAAAQAASSATAALLAAGASSCASSSPEACAWLRGTLALLAPCAAQLPQALTWAAALSCAACAACTAAGLGLFLRDHSRLVALRARRAAVLSEHTLARLGLRQEGGGGSSSSSAQPVPSTLGSLSQEPPEGAAGSSGEEEGGLGHPGQLQPAAASAAAGALGPLTLLHPLPAATAAAPPSAASEPTASRLSAWRLGLDLLPPATALTRLHSLPAFSDYSHTLAFDFLPTQLFSALLAYALLTAVLTALLTCLLLAGAARAALLLTVLLSVCLVSLRYAAYSALTLVLARWGREEEGSSASTSSSAGSRGGAGSARSSKRAAGGRVAGGLALSRLFMLLDTVATFSPISMACGLASGLCRLALGLLLWPLSLLWVHRPFGCLGRLDPAFATYSGLLRVAYMGTLPPGFEAPREYSSSSGGGGVGGGGGKLGNPWGEEAGGEAGEEEEEEAREEWERAQEARAEWERAGKAGEGLSSNVFVQGAAQGSAAAAAEASQAGASLLDHDFLSQQQQQQQQEGGGEGLGVGEAAAQGYEPPGQGLGSAGAAAGSSIAGAALSWLPVFTFPITVKDGGSAQAAASSSAVAGASASAGASTAGSGAPGALVQAEAPLPGQPALLEHTALVLVPEEEAASSALALVPEEGDGALALVPEESEGALALVPEEEDAAQPVTALVLHEEAEEASPSSTAIVPVDE